MNPFTQRRWDRIADHVCTQCGVREPVEGYRLCDPCLEVRLDSLKRLQEDRAKKGLCKLHGNPVVPGKKSCVICQNRWRTRQQLLKIRSANGRVTGNAPDPGVAGLLQGEHLLDARVLQETGHSGA